MYTAKALFTWLTLAFFLALTGCVSTQVTEAPPPPLPDRYNLPALDEPIRGPEEGTIFSVNSKNIYSDNRASQVGDILLIKIVETSSGSKTATTKTSRDSTLEGGISSLFGFEKWFKGPHGQHTPSLTSMNADIAKEFEGKGETSRDSTVTATISARVVEKSMDGNLKIRGYREIRVNNETQHIILSGIVRPDDIAKDNSVLSTHIADARIEYTGTGTLSNKQQPGWLANALDVVWPF